MNQTMNKNASGTIEIHNLAALIFDNTNFQVRNEMAIPQPNG